MSNERQPPGWPTFDFPDTTTNQAAPPFVLFEGWEARTYTRRFFRTGERASCHPLFAQNAKNGIVARSPASFFGFSTGTTGIRVTDDLYPEPRDMQGGDMRDAFTRSLGFLKTVVLENPVTLYSGILCL